jgi:hypothetical protein
MQGDNGVGDIRLAGFIALGRRTTTVSLGLGDRLSGRRIVRVPPPHWTGAILGAARHASLRCGRPARAHPDIPDDQGNREDERGQVTDNSHGSFQDARRPIKESSTHKQPSFSAACPSVVTDTSRYTGAVGWRERIALLVLTVMTALPAAGAFCAMTCASAAEAMAAHHAAGQRCDDATVTSSSSQIGVRSGHDCRTHDGAVLSMATTPAVRADVGLTAPPATNEGICTVAAGLVPFTPPFAYTPRPGTAPPTTTPLVLRV